MTLVFEVCNAERQGMRAKLHSHVNAPTRMRIHFLKRVVRPQIMECNADGLFVARFDALFPFDGFTILTKSSALDAWRYVWDYECT